MDVNATQQRIPDGELILEEGTWAYYGYVLRSGKAKVYKHVDGRQMLIGTLEEGDVFGEVAFLGDAKRTASVVADGDVEVEMIPKDVFFDALKKLPEGIRSTLGDLVGDLTLMDELRGRLLALLPALQNVKSKTVNLASVEEEIEDMPEILGRVFMALVQRLNLAVEGMAKLAAQAEETVNLIDSRS